MRKEEIKNYTNGEWKKQDEKYLFELQKFLDITDNIKNENLRKDVIAQMLKCDKRLTQLAEEIFLLLTTENKFE